MKNSRLKTVVLFHSTPAVMAPVLDLGARMGLPVTFLNLVDEPLFEELFRSGPLSPTVKERVIEHIRFAERMHAAALLCTCSSLSPVLERQRDATALPLVTIDGHAIEVCVEKWDSILLLATSPTTVGPSRNRINEAAARCGKPVSVVPLLCSGALEAYREGDLPRHDRLVLECLEKRRPAKYDGVLLAQASLTHIEPLIRSLGYDVEACAVRAFESLSEVLYGGGHDR
jgi:hypothetical protein